MKKKDGEKVRVDHVCQAWSSSGHRGDQNSGNVLSKTPVLIINMFKDNLNHGNRCPTVAINVNMMINANAAITLLLNRMANGAISILLFTKLEARLQLLTL